MSVSNKQLRRIIRRTVSEQVAVPDNGGAPPAAVSMPQVKQKRWKAEVTDDYDKGYKDGMVGVDPSEDASRSYDDGYTDALADLAEEENIAAMPQMERTMRITRKQLRETIKEMQMIREDSIDTELDHLKKNVADDLDHIKDLKDDIKDDHEEEVRAEKEKHRKDESRRRAKKVGYNQLRKMIREMHQGYDAREDERLAALHGPAADHEQSYEARRDDAEYEERHHHEDQGYDDREDERLAAKHGSAAHHTQDYADRRDDAHFEKRHHESLKRRLRRIVRENTKRRRR
jgi:hypothetical protein